MTDPQSNLTVAEILRGVLARAEAGEITGVMVATIRPDGSTGSAWSLPEATVAEALGSVQILNARLLAAVEDA